MLSSETEFSNGYQNSPCEPRSGRRSSVPRLARQVRENEVYELINRG